MGLMGAIKGAFGAARGRPQAAPNNQGMMQRLAQSAGQAAGGIGPSPELMQKPGIIPQLQPMTPGVNGPAPQPPPEWLAAKAQFEQAHPESMSPQQPQQMMGGMGRAIQAARPGMQIPMRPNPQQGRGLAPRFLGR